MKCLQAKGGVSSYNRKNSATSSRRMAAQGGADGRIPAEGVGKGGEEGGGVDVLLGEETIEQLIAGEFGDMGRGNPLTI